MLKNYFRVAVRYFGRHKLFSAINICCLALGIGFSLIIGNYVLDQLAVDQSFRNVRQQYILHSDWKIKDQGLDITTFGPLAKTLKTEYPSLVANYYRYNPVTTVVSVGNRYFNEDVAIGDTTLVSMYGLPVLYGNPSQVFEGDHSLVLTESKALKLFGRKEVVNEAVSMQTTQPGEWQQYKVSAVLKDIPHNSVTGLLGGEYEIFVPTTGNRFFQGGDPAEGWSGAYEVSMVEWQPGADAGAVARATETVLKKYTPPQVYQNLHISFLPLSHFHLQNNQGAVQARLNILVLIGAFILIMAVFNFVNISIGMSTSRLKEIGLRKVFGSSRGKLIVQHLAEAVMVSGVALLFAAVLYQLLAPLAGRLLGAPLKPIWQIGTARGLAILLFVVLVGLLAGLYPALLLSGLNVTRSVKGVVETPDSGFGFRRILLVLQFGLSILILICTWNVSRQVSYLFHTDPGYHKDQLLIMRAYPKQWDSLGVARMESIKNQLSQVPGVREISIAGEIPERRPPVTLGYIGPNKSASQALNLPTIIVDQDYARTFGIPLVAGSFFRPAGEAYIANQIVLNESAARAFGLDPRMAVGQSLTLSTGNSRLTIAGVIRDYHYQGMQQAIEPMVMLHTRDGLFYRFMAVSLEKNNIPATVDRLRAKWKELSPQAPFEYFFMDEKFQQLYQSELQMKQAAALAAVLSVIIVFVGMFGTMTITLVRRNRELAIRKVLGAKVPDLLGLFLRDYCWLIGLATALAWPLAYWFNVYWARQFAYHVSPSAWPYIGSAFALLISSLGLLGAQCLRQVSRNPVPSLRNE